MKKTTLFGVGYVLVALATTSYPLLASGIGDSGIVQLPSDWEQELARTALDVPGAVSRWQSDEARKKAEPDHSAEDAYAYKVPTNRRDPAVFNAMCQIIENPSAETKNLRGGAGTGHPFGLSLSQFVFPFTYKSGYETQPARYQAAFAYDLARFQDVKGVSRHEHDAHTDAEFKAQQKALRYQAYENFAVAWWYANSPYFRTLTIQQRQDWAFDSLLDGVLLYNRYLVENVPGNHGEISTFFQVTETSLARAHMRQDKNLSV